MSPKKKSKTGIKKPTEPFAGWSEKAIRDSVSDITFKRGLEYFEVGCVRALRVYRNEVKAEVEGSTTYNVRLWDDGKRIDGSCDCPAYEDMGFCKHCVAVSLALVEQIGKGTIQGDANGGKKGSWVTMDGIAEYLGKVGRKKLEGWVMNWALEDADFQSVLEEEAMKAKRKKAGRKG
jgi:hypothetical protein